MSATRTDRIEQCIAFCNGDLDAAARRAKAPPAEVHKVWNGMQLINQPVECDRCGNPFERKAKHQRYCGSRCSRAVIRAQEKARRAAQFEHTLGQVAS